jgi:epoxyqueuosine reductase
MYLESEIKNFSKNIGIDAIGITSAKPFNNVKRIFIDRVKRGFYKDLNYNTEKVNFICNPKNILTDAKSIISIALSYNVPIEEEKTKKREISYEYDMHSDKQKTKIRGNTGIIAKFAWGIDYHKVLKNKLKILVDFISKKLLNDFKKSFKYKILVDTGPIVDRAVANRAGIGFYGKNCNILTKRFGSWVLLGEIVTNLKLKTDEPNFENCGDCDLCIRACPTGAIISPYVIDVRKCISNITQKSGVIPLNLLEKIGKRIYGCDICQDVCPLNKEAEIVEKDYFLPISPRSKDIDLLPLICMSEIEFNRWFKNSAISWVGKDVLRRNAIIALGNIGKSNSMDFLSKVIEDKDEIIRKYASWAINKIKKDNSL